MSTNQSSACCTKVAVYVVVTVSTLLLAKWLADSMKTNSRPPTINAARVEERVKALKEVRAAGETELNNTGWVDQGRGVARLPIDVAMDLTIKRYQNPAAARADMNARVEKATAKAPEKPSAFE